MIHVIVTLDAVRLKCKLDNLLQCYKKYDQRSFDLRGCFHLLEKRCIFKFALTSSGAACMVLSILRL